MGVALGKPRQTETVDIAIHSKSTGRGLQEDTRLCKLHWRWGDSQGSAPTQASAEASPAVLALTVRADDELAAAVMGEGNAGGTNCPNREKPFCRRRCPAALFGRPLKILVLVSFPQVAGVYGRSDKQPPTSPSSGKPHSRRS